MGVVWKRKARNVLFVLATTVVITLTWSNASGQAKTYQGRRTPDGKPDLNGIWQALDTSVDWDIQPHGAEAGPVAALGAEFAVPPGLGIVEGGEIPYLPAALAQKKKNFEQRLTADPEIKCYMPGVPRGNYMPYPFQIVQSPGRMMMVYQFANAVRQIYMHNPGPSPADSWMGWSVAHWDGDTLVVDVTGLNDQTWLDRAGDYHSDALHVVERYTLRSTDVLMYEATIEDHNVYTRPWKMSLPLYRHVEKNAQLLEYKCVPFAEEMLYGSLRKKTK
jgi:hypothetical protein